MLQIRVQNTLRVSLVGYFFRRTRVPKPGYIGHIRENAGVHPECLPYKARGFYSRASYPTLISSNWSQKKVCAVPKGMLKPRPPLTLGTLDTVYSSEKTIATLGDRW